MSTILKSLALAVAGIGMSFVAATPASAATPACDLDRVNTCVATIIDINGGGDTGGSCNGAVDTNCSYCAHNSSNVASPNNLCDDDWTGYSYETCGTWVAAQCVVG